MASIGFVLFVVDVAVFLSFIFFVNEIEIKNKYSAFSEGPADRLLLPVTPGTPSAKVFHGFFFYFLRFLFFFADQWGELFFFAFFFAFEKILFSGFPGPFWS